MKKIGLTGNIASGKSSVEKILVHKGILVYDLDKICASLYQNDEQIKKQILDKFKTLDKKEIAKIVFENTSERKALEAIIHPKLKEIILELFKNTTKTIVISGALIYEAGFDNLFDKIIFIDAPYKVRLERLKRRNNLDEKEAKKRLSAQSDKYKQKADYIIENNSSLDILKQKVDLTIKDLELL